MIEGPVTNRRFSRRRMRQVTVAAGVLALVVAVAGSAYWIYQGRARHQAEAAERAAQSAAQDIAHRIAEPFSALRSRLMTLGAGAEVIAALEVGDDAALEALADAGAGTFPGALRLRLLRPGTAVPDPDATPPFSYASLDMLRRVEESGAPVGAELHLSGTPEQHIVVAAPALDQAGRLRGLLHLSLDAALLQQAVDAVALPGGRVAVRQAAGAREVTIAAAGQDGDGDAIIVAVPDTRWSLAYTPAGSTARAPDGGGFPIPVPAAIGFVAAAAVAVLVMMRRRRRKADIDAEAGGAGITYAGAVKAIMDGAHPGVEKLVPNLPDLGQSRPVTAVSRGMSGSDITLIAPRSELAAKAETTDPTPVPAQPRPARKPSPAPVAPAASAPGAAPEVTGAGIDPGIFRAYDIRGVVGKTLTVDVVTKIGQAIGSEAAARGLATLAVGRDGRLSSPELAAALSAGLRAAGRNVIDIGMVPTPVLYFATHELDVHGGVMVTGSHNGPEYNGLKIVLGGETLSEDAIRGLCRRITEGKLESGQGTLESADVVAAYIRRISEDIPVALGGALRVVIDCGNGVAGAVAPQLISALGHDVIEMHCEVDGRFPHHHPDPSQPENMRALVERVQAEGADLGLAFDGDGDRLGVVDATGRIVWPDQQLMILARDVLTRNPGAPIIFDVKCSRHLAAAIEAAGGKALMWRTGHSLIKHKMKECDAPLAGEMSGHIFFKERWYGFDDALYTAARMLEVLMRAKRKPADVFAELPHSVATPELRVTLAESEHGRFMEALRGRLPAGARIIDIDGFRLEFPDGWGLVRPSNTSPALVVRFEADSDAALDRIKDTFRTMMLAASPGLTLPF